MKEAKILNRVEAIKPGRVLKKIKNLIIKVIVNADLY